MHDVATKEASDDSERLRPLQNITTLYPSLKIPTILYLFIVEEVVEFYPVELFIVGDASDQLQIKASVRL